MSGNSTGGYDAGDSVSDETVAAKPTVDTAATAGSSADEAEIVVRNDVGTHRFIIEVDGVEAGFTQYEQFTKMRDFSHTEIDEAFAGRGLAGKLVREALTQTKQEGLAVEATCPVVQRFLKTHPDF